MSLLLQLPDTASVTPLVGDAWELPVRLLIDLACVLLLVRGVYYRTYRRANLFLTLISFNVVIFLISYMLNAVEMTMGAAFGLFAVFSMLRFRTEEVSVNDMTYLFLSVALGLLMAVHQGGWLELAIIAWTILGGTWVLEAAWFAKRERAKSVLYDNLALVASGSQAALIEDVRTRTGLPVHRVDVRDIDLLKDVATLKVYYHVTQPTE